MMWALLFIFVVLAIAIPIYSAMVVGSRADEEYYKSIKREKTAQNPAIKQKGGEVIGGKNNGGNSGDFCVVCGEIVPEGRQVCQTCEEMSKGERK